MIKSCHDKVEVGAGKGNIGYNVSISGCGPHFYPSCRQIR